VKLRRRVNLATAIRGVLEEDDGTFFCFTLEEPWRDLNLDGVGDRGVSCIPAGTYQVFRRWSASRRREVFEVRGVPGRTAILIHSGNTVADTEGCILIGQREGVLEQEPAVLMSKIAVEALMRRFEKVNIFTLTVTDAPKG
jgi:hypothetical protein